MKENAEVHALLVVKTQQPTLMNAGLLTMLMIMMVCLQLKAFLDVCIRMLLQQSLLQTQITTVLVTQKMGTLHQMKALQENVFELLQLEVKIVIQELIVMSAGL